MSALQITRAPAQALSALEQGAIVTDLPAWRICSDGVAIERTLVFPDFIAVMGFMMQTAFQAEVLDHHPEWSNVYNRLHIRLTTHDLGGLSDRDLALARIIEALAATSAPENPDPVENPA